jgi:hypothetical protein
VAMKAVLLMVVLAVLAGGQSQNTYARYDVNGNMTSVISLFDFASDEDCRGRETYSGVISKVEYNNQKQIESFSLKVQRKGRKPIVLVYAFPLDPYEGGLEPNELTKLPALIREGNRVRVDGYECGLKATAFFSHSIYKL